MQQIYRRTPMAKCDFNKVTLQLYWNHTITWVFSCKFATYFQKLFNKNISGWMLLQIASFHRVPQEYCTEYFWQIPRESSLKFQSSDFPGHRSTTASVTSRSSHWRCFVREGDLKNFAKLTRKHLCQSLFW